ncbi:hypothetical protein [Helicobacter ibis]|uniref:Periplasmic protein n=1 Tax=Helicobacter ibis TaxID=2962633 RepID=A0ABT4VDX0_9HELI|nr:hypothetical protein [Helicobacter ibis]MDA3968388.1 hypothetical protein [Helicobacter ibis]
MKLFVVFLSCISFIFASEMVIKQNLSVGLEVLLTDYVADVNILSSEKLKNTKNLSTATKNEIIKTYNTINELIKQSSICSGGEFSINPYHTYNNGSMVQSGYDSMYSLKCKFNEENKGMFNTMLSSIETIVSKNSFLQLPIPAITKQASYESQNDTLKQLNNKMILEAISLAKEYSNISHKSCYVKEINLDNNRNVMPMLANDSRAKNELSGISMPVKSKEMQKLNGLVIFACK